jgi:hypothetical protein
LFVRCVLVAEWALLDYLRFISKSTKYTLSQES